MNRLGHRIVAWLGKAALKTHALQTLRDCRASPNRAKRLECVRFIGAFRLAPDGQRFMVPMHAEKTKGGSPRAHGNRAPPLLDERSRTQEWNPARNCLNQSLLKFYQLTLRRTVRLRSPRSIEI